MKSASSALFFLRYFSPSSSSSSEIGDIQKSDKANEDVHPTTNVKIMGFLKQRAKANVSLGKMRNAAKGYTEAIKEGKRLLRESKMKKADTEKLVSKLYVERGELHEQVEKYAEATDNYKKALKLEEMMVMFPWR